MHYEVRIPDVGEAKDIEVIEICVAPGEQVAAGDVLVVLESDKASMEVTDERAGKVVSIHVKLGDKVESDSLVVTLETEAASATPEKDEEKDEEKDGKDGEHIPDDSQTATKENGGGTLPTEQSAVAAASPAVTASADNDKASKVYASPGVRRMARELGVDLTAVSATGARGRVLQEDVRLYVKNNLGAGGQGIPGIPPSDFSKFGPVEIEPVGRIMKRGAEHLHQSWLNLPHVTQHEEADITELETFRRAQKEQADETRKNLTLLPFVLKACAGALSEHQKLNGSFTDGGQSYVLKGYIHIGIAVDTPEGLLVPVIRDVDKKGIWALNEEIHDLATRSRNRKLKPEEMQGGSFSVSSLGVIGGTGFTPIINAPEVAILGVARADWKPVYQADSNSFVPRLIVPLSLSYDHRAVNGAYAGRFTTALAQRLADLRLLLM